MNPADDNQNNFPSQAVPSFGVDTSTPPPSPTTSPVENQSQAQSTFASSPAAFPPSDTAGQDTLPATAPIPGNAEPPGIVTSNDQQNQNGKKKKVLAAFLVVVMLFGIGAGVYAFRNYQAGQTSAWDCALYTFNIDQNGTVTVQNGSSHNVPAQKADVYINGTLVQTFDVPALNSGGGATLGTVSLPANQSYIWRVDGSQDCDDSGSHEVDTVTGECSAVVAYDENWTLLTSNALSQLKAGDVVRFAVTGTATSGTFDMARFSVNGETPQEVTDTKPGSANEFYYEYTIPTGVSTFNVSAEVHHTEMGWF